MAVMKKTMYGAVFALLALIPAASQAATIPALYTNDNFWTSEHDQPASFSSDEYGNFWGITLTGKTFYQTNIENTASIRLQRFSIDEAFYYVSDRGIIIAPTDLTALSMYLARV